MKKCYTCKKLKNLSEFGKNSAKDDNLQINCKCCYNKYARDYKKRNPDVYLRANAKKSKEAVTEYQKAYQKIYRARPENKAKAKIYQKKYHESF